MLPHGPIIMTYQSKPIIFFYWMFQRTLDYIVPIYKFKYKSFSHNRNPLVKFVMTKCSQTLLNHTMCSEAAP
jgi:hypothetical protein